MTDGNTQAIAQYLDEREEWDALQEVTVELEQAEARIEELEAGLEHNKKRMLVLAGDKINLVSELAGVKGKLEKAIALAEEALEFNNDGDDYIEWSSIWERIKELKGETG